MNRYGLADWDAAVRALKDARSVALATHVNPDGDALGSLFGAGLALRAAGAQVACSFAHQPAEVPASYAFLPGQELLVQPGELPEAELFVALDCGAAERLGMLEGRARAAALSINVDHHPGNDRFATYNIVAPGASSTAELVTDLLADAGLALDRDIATCLYTGIVTDTGAFQYASATPDTLRLAADLRAHGVPHDVIAQEVFESSPFGYLKLVGHVLERALLHERERFVYSWVTRHDLAETGVRMDETDKLIDLIRATRDADVAAIFKEQEDGRFRVSLRSKGRVSVGAIARSQGGGGHERAAGFTAPSVEEGVAAILAALR